ncbi:MAG: molybdenum cofactor biosynthesis protein MoaE [Flavobacteriales bacterium]
MNHFLLTPNVLDESASVIGADDACGALVIFVGHVRDTAHGQRVSALEFEAYEPMVISELEKIADEIIEQWPVKHVLLHHRTGRCNVGEAAVVAAVSSPHRAEAFEACAFLMNRLKATVPIWKREITEAGEVWVSATP